jgi:hypothetical protein
MIEDFSIQQIIECSSDKKVMQTKNVNLDINFGCLGGYVFRAY